MLMPALREHLFPLPEYFFPAMKNKDLIDY
jgi:hypothetical protein